MRLIIGCFARALQSCTSRISMHFLLAFQDVILTSNTRNQFIHFFLMFQKVRLISNTRNQFYICRQVQRQLLRNESARCYHHRTRKCIPPRKLHRERQ